MTTMPKSQPTAAHQRRLASIWRVGMGLMLLGLFSDTAGQVWNNLTTAGWTWQDHALAVVLALLGGSLGLVLTLYAAVQFQKGPLPRFAVSGENRGLDEREVAQLMAAQARTQRLFVTFTMAMMPFMAWGNGVHLSQWSCWLGFLSLLNAVIYLPISLLAAETKDVEGKE